MEEAARSKQVLDYLDARQEELIAFAAELVAAPSPNPPGDERAVVRVILDKMAALGLHGSEIIAQKEERPNLLYRLRGQTAWPALLYNGHVDTKPVTDDDRPLWRTDPLTPTITDGKLYGLGATDMKGAVAALVYATAAVAQASPPVNGDLILALVADEEAVTGYGAKYLVSATDIKADFGLVAEPGGIHEEFENLPLFCRGSYYFKVKVYGTQTHASISDQVPTVNASVKMAWVLWRMARDLRLIFTPHPYYPQGPTITPGVMVKGGVYLGVHPGYAEFATDIRILPGMTHEQVTADIEAFLAGLQAEDPELKVEMEFIGGAIQGSLRGDEPFVKILQDASEQVLGRRPPLGGFPAYTDAYWFHQVAGIPTVAGFGPGFLPLAHGPNEYVPTESILQAAKIYALAAVRYLSQPRE